MRDAGVTDRSTMQAALGRVLASKTFERSEQLKRLLSYLCQRAETEPAAQITEAAIAEEVFRRVNFDPGADTIVRSQMRRLRHKLQEYYEGEGAGDAFRLQLEKHNYCPFVTPAPPPEPRAPAQPMINSFWKGFLTAGVIAAALFILAKAIPGTSGRPPQPIASSFLWSGLAREEKPLLAVATPLFFRTPHSYIRDFRLNSPEDLELATKLLATPHAWPVWETWMGASDVQAALLASSILQQLGRTPEIRAARSVTTDEIRTRAVLFIGHPRGAPVLAEMLSAMNFHVPTGESGTEKSGFRNRNPKPGEPASFQPKNTDPLQRLSLDMPDHLLVTLQRDAKARFTVSVFGNRYDTNLFGVKLLAKEDFLKSLEKRIWPGGSLEFRQVQLVLEVRHVDGKPVEAAYVTHRLDGR